MPTPLPGEADLRAHAEQFVRAEAYVAALVGFAIDDPQGTTRLALERLNALRLLDHRRRRARHRDRRSVRMVRAARRHRRGRISRVASLPPELYLRRELGMTSAFWDSTPSGPAGSALGARSFENRAVERDLSR